MRQGGSVFFVVYCQLQWVRRPEDTSVTEGTNVTLYCQVSGSPAGVTWVGPNRETLTINSQPFATGSRYSIDGNYNLKIIDVRKTDNGEYACNIANFENGKAILTILVTPGVPQLTSNKTTNYQEGDVVAFTCSSVGGNPAPTITWLRNGQTLSSAVYTPPDAIFQTASSRLVIVMSSEDDQANYTCVVKNSVNQDKPVQDVRILDVKYSPIITFIPPSPVGVKIGEDLSVECYVKANPAVNSRQWKRPDGTIIGGVTTSFLTYAKIARQRAGLYSCSASNEIGTTETTVLIDVLYEPVITIPSTTVVNISDQVNISCDYDANPPPYNVQWEREGMPQFVRNGPFLIFSQVTVSNSGNYTCAVTNTMRSSMSNTSDTVATRAYTYIYVSHPPGNAFISPVSAVNVGDTLTLRCSVDDAGYPLAQFEWTKFGSAAVIFTSANYAIGGITLAQGGEYMCQPWNALGRGASTSIMVTVNEPPVLVTGMLATKQVPLTDQGFSLQCVFRGKPAPQVTWSKDNIILNTDNHYEILNVPSAVDTYSFEVRTTLYFRGEARRINAGASNSNLRPDDAGIYSCSVTSRVNSATELFITYAPVTGKTLVKVAPELGLSATLRCDAEAYPAAQLSWQRGAVQLVNQASKYTIVSETLPSNWYRSSLTISNTAASDFGEYSCIANNSIGSSTELFSVRQQSPPEAPANLSIVLLTWESAELTWNAGFNGGANESFYIAYSSQLGIHEVAVKPPQAHTYTITRLMPSTSYRFAVFGKNRLGDGNQSTVVTSRTDSIGQIPTVLNAVFSVSDKSLTFTGISNKSYCAKLDISTYGQKGKTFMDCTNIRRGVIPINITDIVRLNMSLCLLKRQDVCGYPVIVTIVDDGSGGGLSNDAVIGIACGCGLIVIILLSILGVVLFRRRKGQAAKAKDYESDPAHSRPPPSNGSVPHIQKSVGYDNPGRDMVDSYNVRHQGRSYPLSPVHTNSIPNGYYGSPQKANMSPRGTNGSVPLDKSYDSNQDRERFENSRNLRNQNLSGTGDPYGYGRKRGDLEFHSVPASPRKDQFIDLQDSFVKEDEPSGNESGYSTPDAVKPRKTKVFHEVVV